MTACIAADCSRQLREHEIIARQLVCDPCLNGMRATLRAIPAALIVLREGSMQRERTGETGRAGTREAPLPCRIDTLNLIGPAASGTVHDPYGDQIGQRAIIDVLGSWTRILCEERRLNGPQQWTEVALAGWLASQLGFASTQPWIAELHGELRDLLWAIRGIARVEVRTRAISRPCPNSECGLLTLTRTDWDQYVRCSSCGNAYTDSELNADAIARSAA
jgi:hypothetical protein